ncbi:hypothetical protein [Aliamphritea hakodatensis]|uniref:hypothetical protein n=1 Tax=Aliamphritea hakodatensis TaxID=2895352 RepID=UPI0022FD620E|nr:hypothetical protein [Aliamphritea hakodatensis]
MKMTAPLKTLFVSLTLAISSQAMALGDCQDQQSFCEAKCEVRHLGDEAAVNGCYAKCTASRAVCSTKEGAKEVYEAGEEGAKTAVEVGKDAVDSTKSFFKGIFD